MRINLKHNTVRRGLILKKTFVKVTLTVLFSHEEIQILRQRGLLDQHLLDRRPATAKVDDRDEKFALHVRHIVNGKVDRFLLANPAAAKVYQNRVLDTLAQLKIFISDNAEFGDDFVVEF